MVHLIRIGGLLGILLSLACQLLAITDDSYTFGNFGILGILSGVVGTYASFMMEEKRKTANILIILSVAAGIYALSFFYLIPAIFMIIPLIVMNLPAKNEE